MTLAHRCAVAAVSALLLTGCTSAVNSPSPAPSGLPSPGAEEPLPTLVDSEWDTIITREFDGDDGVVTCTAHIRAEGDNDDATAASAFLAAGDWDSVEVSLDMFDAGDLAARRKQGVSDPELLMMLVTDKASEDLSNAGLFTTNVSVQMDTRCD